MDCWDCFHSKGHVVYSWYYTYSKSSGFHFSPQFSLKSCPCYCILMYCIVNIFLHFFQETGSIALAKKNCIICMNIMYAHRHVVQTFHFGWPSVLTKCCEIDLQSLALLKKCHLPQFKHCIKYVPDKCQSWAEEFIVQNFCSLCSSHLQVCYCTYDRKNIVVSTAWTIQPRHFIDTWIVFICT